MLDFSASDYLTRHRAAAGGNSGARSSSISGTRRQKNQILADFTAADIANFWLLYTINTAFPIFRHCSKRAAAIPEALYSAMLSLAGALTTFSPIFIRAICRFTITKNWATASPISRETALVAGNGGAEQLRRAAVETDAAVHLRDVDR